MDDQVIHRYFEKAVALVLASAGVDSVEKQALHLLAGEAERYARTLGALAGKLAEAARRSECTVTDINAAARSIGSVPRDESTGRININSDLKKKLRLSVELNPPIEKSVSTVVHMPQTASDSVETLMAGEEGLASPNKNATKRTLAYPEWLQREVETKQLLQPYVSRLQSKTTGQSKQQTGAADSGPLSYISSLVLAEEESREILTKKIKTEQKDRSTSRRAALG